MAIKLAVLKWGENVIADALSRVTGVEHVNCL